MSGTRYICEKGDLHFLLTVLCYSFPSFHHRVSPSRMPPYTPISNARNSPPHPSRLHLLSLPAKITKLVSLFLDVPDIVRLLAVCTTLRGFVLTSLQPRFKACAVELGWGLVPKGVVGDDRMRSVKKTGGAVSEVASVDSPASGDWA